MNKFRLILLGLSLTSFQTYAAIDETALAVWANEAIVATYTYNYQNFMARQKEIAKYFTATGWISYSKALQKSKIPESVQQNTYNVNAVATLPPTIKTLNAQHWQATMPILVVYKNAKYQQKQTLNITLTFMPAPANQGVRGLAIESLQAVIAEPACQCMPTS